MKRFFALLTIGLLAASAWADEVTFDASLDLGTGDDVAHAYWIEKDGIKIEVSNGKIASNHYRVYKNQTMTVTSSVGQINEIFIECITEGDAQFGPGCFTAAPGEYTWEGKTGTWVGNDEQVVFTASLSQVRITRITVTIGEGGLSAPVIKPASGTYYDPLEVIISCRTEGASIYYTTDGSDPTTSSALYTDPFMVSENTTVKAISAIDDKVSHVVQADYVFDVHAQVTPVQNIWEATLLADGSVVLFVNPVTVVVQKNSYLFVKDESGYGLFYGQTHQSYVTGDVIPAGFVGTMKTYACERELADLSGFQPASGNVPLEPELITADRIGHETFAHLVKLNGVRFVNDGSGYWITDGYGNQAAVRFGMGPGMPSDLSLTYDVIGVVGSHGDPVTGCIYQLLPIVIQAPQPQGTVIKVIYQSNPYMYAKLYRTDSDVDPGAVVPLDLDEDKGEFKLIYGHLTNHFVNGDVILNPRFSVTEYAGVEELIPVDETFVLAYHDDPVEPIEMPIEEISADMVNWYLLLRGVDYNENLLSDDTGEMAVYNRFGVPVVIYNPLPECDFDPNDDCEINIGDVNAVVNEILIGGRLIKDPLYGKYDIAGFLSVYKGLYQFYPVSIVYHAHEYVTIYKGDVNGDKEVNIADVNVLIDYILQH
ncbi:MAG: chitobiase/beta-hexosaminidase C-terminal domain-containing protein [Muribaculaceae bacterium]|nr:chitobiase/beta-hexosaminidase C-terminal domain-containing protein [Muribaculaceae bacterium]